MQYVVSLLAVNDNFQIKSLVIGMFFFSICRMFNFCVTAEALPLSFQYMLQYGLTYTMQTLTNTYDANVRMYPDT